MCDTCIDTAGSCCCFVKYWRLKCSINVILCVIKNSLLFHSGTLWFFGVVVVFEVICYILWIFFDRSRTYICIFSTLHFVCKKIKIHILVESSKTTTCTNPILFYINPGFLPMYLRQCMPFRLVLNLFAFFWCVLT